MSADEFAVHYSHRHTCDIFSSLAEAEAFAAEQIAREPNLRCRIYDHHGLGKAPLKELRGGDFRGDKDFSPKVRLALGLGLFGTGSILFAFDWVNDFRYTWPGVLGSRLVVPGLIVLVTDGIFRLNEWHKRYKQIPSPPMP